jgi:hypothetical protein
MKVLNFCKCSPFKIQKHHNHLGFKQKVKQCKNLRFIARLRKGHKHCNIAK